MNWRRISGFAVVGFVGLGQACSSGGQGASDRPRTTTTSLPITTSTTAPEAAVLAAYQAGWDAYVFFGSRDGLTSPDLAGLAYPQAFEKVFGDLVTGDQYDNLFEALQPIRADSEFRGGRAAIENRVRVVSPPADGEAVLRDCYDDNLQIWNRRTQTRTDQDDPRRHLIEVRMVFKEGRWKAEKATSLGDGCSEP